MKECYECGAKVHELSPRSRCVMCEYRRSQFNEDYSEIKDAQIASLEERLWAMALAKQGDKSE